MTVFCLLIFRNRDIIDEENPYDAVTIEEGTKIYEDLVSYQRFPVGLMRLYTIVIDRMICKTIILLGMCCVSVTHTCTVHAFPWLNFHFSLFYTHQYYY